MRSVGDREAELAVQGAEASEALVLGQVRFYSSLWTSGASVQQGHLGGLQVSPELGGI